jgi:Mg-chelatase subunit ChlD
MIALLIAAVFAAHTSQATRAQEPLDVVLLVDVSDSLTTGAFTRDRSIVTVAANAFADALQPNDIARVGTFGATLALDDAPLKDASAVRAAGAQLAGHLGGSSPIWDALDAAARLLEPSRRRRAIVLITDGRATGNRVGFNDVLATLQRDRIAVAVIALDKSLRPIPDPGARLEQLAKTTGGVVFFVEKAALPAAVGRAISSLRTLR